MQQHTATAGASRVAGFGPATFRDALGTGAAGNEWHAPPVGRRHGFGKVARARGRCDIKEQRQVQEQAFHAARATLLRHLERRRVPAERDHVARRVVVLGGRRGCEVKHGPARLFHWRGGAVGMVVLPDRQHSHAEIRKAGSLRVLPVGSEYPARHHVAAA